ncbi:MAG: hypothetical protein ICV84_07515 [Flavisolibacter sp.]|nr:hypothetical protein [Flavisolibacter sp.]
MNLRITNGFDRLSDPRLLVRAQEIFNAMMNNPGFPTPVPALADVQTKIFEYSNAISAALEGGKYSDSLEARSAANSLTCCMP